MEVSRLGDGHRGSARGETDCQGSCSEILYAQEYNTRPLQFEGQGSSRPGPAPVLTVKGEKELVQWIIKMAEIGYGQCRQQVTTMVKKILDTHNRPNPFPDIILGKDWWYAFLRRHPEISLCTPQALEACRAKACTPRAINSWYMDFEQFLLTHSLIE